MVVYIEVSELKRAEEELRLVTGQLEARVEIRTAQLEAERNFMNSVLDSMLETVVTIDEQGVIQSMNRAGEKMFGYSANEIIGRNVSTLIPEPYRSEHDGYIQRYLRSGEPHIIGKGRELPVQRRDGSTFPAWLTVTEAEHHGRHVFTGMLHDLTEQRRAEKEATEHREELTHLHRTSILPAPPGMSFKEKSPLVLARWPSTTNRIIGRLHPAEAFHHPLHVELALPAPCAFQGPLHHLVITDQFAHFLGRGTCAERDPLDAGTSEHRRVVQFLRGHRVHDDPVPGHLRAGDVIHICGKFHVPHGKHAHDLL